MCRWIAYTGAPIFIEQVVTLPTHSLVEQSIRAKMNHGINSDLLSINADGFGIGWYAEKKEPGLFKDEVPAWSNENLHEVCRQVKAKIFFSHVRARTTGAVQRSNCHPFKYRRWLFQHNGYIRQFDRLRQSLHQAIAPKLYPHLSGTTDSETIFMLALTYGLERNPKRAFQNVVELIRNVAARHNTNGILNLSCAFSDGKRIYTIRHADKETPHTQFYSKKSDWFYDVNHTHMITQPKSILVVSEPLDQMDDKWTAIPENSFTTSTDNKIEIEKFI